MASRLLFLSSLLAVSLLVAVSSQQGYTFGGYSFSTYRYLTEFQTSDDCNVAGLWGAGGCTMNRGGSRPRLDCEFVHNVDDFEDVFVYNTAAQTPDIVWQFLDTQMYGFFDSHIVRGEFTLSEDDDEDQEKGFLNGRFVIQVTSVTCPEGAIFGILTADMNLYSELISRNEVPPVASPEEGIVVGNYYPAATNRTMRSVLYHTSSRGTSATVNEGAAGVTGTVLSTFATIATPTTNTVTLTSAQEDELYEGSLYYNFASDLYPSGELRGQAQIIDAIPNANYVFQLTAGQMVPPSSSDATGCALFAVDCENFFVSYMISTDLEDITRITLNFGFAESNGQELLTLNGRESPVFGSFTLSETDYVNLANGNFYIQISSSRYPTGAIRGQLVPQIPFFAYLSGYQEVPPVTTYGRGCGLFQFTDQSTLSYSIVHNLEDDLDSAIIARGDLGENGQSISPLREENDLLLEGTLTITGGDVSTLRNGGMYINLSSRRFDNGEIRGQILASTESCVAYPNYFTSGYYSFSYYSWAPVETFSTNAGTSSDSSSLMVNSSLLLLPLILLFSLIF